MRGTNRTIVRIARRLLIGALIVALAVPTAAVATTAKKGRPPAVKTLKPYGVNDTEGILNSEVSPHGHEISIRFELGKTKRYGRITEIQEEDPYPYFQHQEIEEYVGGLSPNTVYHCRVVATYGGGKKVYGNDVRFKTQRR
jgi:hypothetical protein